MGKKAKLGKKRKDKFYHLAKEVGYRSRASFKLIQLNRKYQFLQKSRVVIDLCAAPGGWLQVVSKFTPISSLVVGVDLVPIKSIPKVVTLQEDITTTRCKQLLQKELQGWKADCVLNDGAPNVGTAWIHDAYSQAELSLHAVKLACHFLRKGGWFITKVFRSKDYQAFLQVLQQLFQKVHATKPQASRTESAEIYVVCSGYRAPDRVDPNLLEASHVFREVEPEGEEKINLVKLQKPPKAVGYPDDATTLYKAVSVSEYITGDKHLTLLATCSKLEFDRRSEVFSRHPLTTDDIRVLCEDVKVLGPSELRQLVKWRDKMKKFLQEVEESEDEKEAKEKAEKKGGGEESEDEMEKIDARIQELEKLEAAEAKREVRYLRKQRRKLKKRLVKDPNTHREVGELTREEYLFRLRDIKNRSTLSRVETWGEKEEEEAEDSNDSGSEVESAEEEDNKEQEEKEDEEEEEEEDEEEEEESMTIEENGEIVQNQQPEAPNPLLVPLEAPVTKSKRTDMWFNQPSLKGLLEGTGGEGKVEEEEEEREEEEVERMVEAYKAKGGQLWKRKEEPENENIIIQHKRPASDESSTSDDEDTEDEADEEDAQNSRPKRQKLDDEERDFEEVAAAPTQPNLPKLDPEGLAVASLLVQSKKKREDLIESAYNRWTYDDEGLPDWFATEEAKFCQKQIPITKEMVAAYRAELREINARPIKKIAEAKARKKMKAMRKMEKAKKQAQGVIDTADMTEHEKSRHIQQIYKKAGLLGKKKVEVKYVVAKKSQAGKRAVRPAGVKGRYRVVDPRMKKDDRTAKMNSRKQKTKGKKKKQ